ncbi:hypothetical protein SNL152K_2098 [Streptomyces sp. NL15-2K]|nr:hypothetical protein SNL152K_2098 [Streptomyces sp. NL15-2K]
MPALLPQAEVGGSGEGRSATGRRGRPAGRTRRGRATAGSAAAPSVPPSETELKHRGTTHVGCDALGQLRRGGRFRSAGANRAEGRLPRAVAYRTRNGESRRRQRPRVAPRGAQGLAERPEPSGTSSATDWRPPPSWACSAAH